MKIAIAAGALVAVALALFALISSSPAAGAAVHGDVDCDGDVDAVDALNVLRSIAGFDVVGECDPPVLDINCNDATEAVDALAILLYVAGFPPPDTGPDCPDIGAEPTPSPSPILTPTPSGSIAPTPTPTPTATGSPTPTPTSTPMPASLCGDPAFAAGATTISSFGPPQEDDYQLVDTGIDAPYATMTDFTTVPYTDGALVLTQDGLIYCVSPNEAPEFLADMSGLLAGGLQIEEGLLTLIFHPDYPAEPYVYIYYNAAREEGESGFAWWDRVSRFEVDLDDDILDLESEEIIIQAEDPAIQHNGAGPIGFGTDGYLYVSFGDGGFGGWDTYASQDTDSLLGKILRIDVLNPPQGQPYGIPGDNPFGNEVWAYGLRNPWRGDIDPDTGDLWVAEVGDGAYDEVIGIVPGGNYGWPIREGPVCWHDREPCDPPPDYVAADVDIPTQFADECAVIGGLVYRGSLMPELGGWFIYSDFCTGDIWGLDTEAVSATPLLLADVDPALPVSSIDSLPGGEIAVTTYDDNGILTLEPKP